MLSDDDIQRVAIQCGMKSGQHWNKGRMNTSRMRAFARVIEREARRQALEDAAQACEEDSGPIIDRWDEGYAAAQRSCVDAIRALKEQP